MQHAPRPQHQQSSWSPDQPDGPEQHRGAAPAAHRRVLDLSAVFGLSATITREASSTGGAGVEMEVTAQPGSRTMIHYHPEQDETYDVEEGTLEVFRGGRWQAVAAGESLTVPRGTVHGFRNAGAAPVRFLNVHTPALGFQKHLETVDRLSRLGKVRGTNDLRSLIYLSMSAVEHRPDVPVRPPHWVIRGLAFIGRRLGYTLEETVCSAGGRRARAAAPSCPEA